jgi:hypothetical protein
MGVVQPVYTELPFSGPGEAWQIQWPHMKNTDTGVSIDLFKYHDRSVQVEGTIGAAGSVSVEGSNDGSTFEVLDDPTGTALTFTTLGKIKEVLEAVWKLRPHVTAGDGTTDITVTFFGRRTNP